MIFVQDNIGISNMLSVHNPLNFIVRIYFSSELPEYCNVVVSSDGEELGTFTCIEYDVTSTYKDYLFIASDIIRSYMSDFEDELILEKEIKQVFNITKEINLHFTTTVGIYEETIDIDFVALHASSQLNETVDVEEVYNNDDTFYCGGENQPVYIYICAEDTDTISINSPLATNYALDYDDYVFTDFDDYLFKID